MCYQNFLFPNAEVLITSMSHSSALLLERIRIEEDARFPGKIVLKPKSKIFKILNFEYNVASHLLTTTYISGTSLSLSKYHVVIAMVSGPYHFLRKVC